MPRISVRLVRLTAAEATMGRYDDSIRHYENQLTDAKKDDGPFGRIRSWVNGTETTQDRYDRNEQNAGLFRRIIKALKAENY
jgi:hypothetical protein